MTTCTNEFKQKLNQAEMKKKKKKKKKKKQNIAIIYI